MAKISIPLEPPKSLSDKEKANWRRKRNFVVCPMVIVTTVSKDGKINAGLKTNFMNISSLRRIAFACNTKHDTYKNIMQTKEFVANFPSEKIINETMITGVTFPYGVNALKKAGLTTIPSEKVKPPRIKKCKAHLECILEDSVKLKGKKMACNVILIGKIIAASVDKDMLKENGKEKLLVLIGWSCGAVGKTKEDKLKIWSRAQKQQAEHQAERK
jgi:flavin reductase (DIM6/NTAB) family NADH-FMN oxidoreductase RutF